MKITIDTKELAKLTSDGKDIFLKPEAEKALLKLLEVQELVTQAIDSAKDELEKSALAVDPNFKSIQGDSVRVYYRAFGSRFYIDEAVIEQVPAEIYKTNLQVLAGNGEGVESYQQSVSQLGWQIEKVKRTVDTKAVDKWAKEHRGLPIGLNEVERKKSITFSVKG